MADAGISCFSFEINKMKKRKKIKCTVKLPIKENICQDWSQNSKLDRRLELEHVLPEGVLFVTKTGKEADT